MPESQSVSRSRLELARDEVDRVFGARRTPGPARAEAACAVCGPRAYGPDGRAATGIRGPWPPSLILGYRRVQRRGCLMRIRTHSCAAAKVLQLATEPDRKPVLNQRWRCSVLPCVKESGRT
jgi:hypothetical protein